MRRLVEVGLRCEALQPPAIPPVCIVLGSSEWPGERGRIVLDGNEGRSGGRQDEAAVFRKAAQGRSWRHLGKIPIPKRTIPANTFPGAREPTPAVRKPTPAAYPA